MSFHIIYIYAYNIYSKVEYTHLQYIMYILFFFFFFFFFNREASEFLGSEDQRIKLQKEIRNKKVYIIS